MNPPLYLTLVLGSFLCGFVLLALCNLIQKNFKLLRDMCEGAGWAYLIAAVCMAWLLEVKP